jgi:hypothetical protein
MLIHGKDLTDRQRAEVLATFVHRWTHENAALNYGGRCPACVQAGSKAAPDWHGHHKPLQTDEEWLECHAFHFVMDGSRLNAKRIYAELALGPIED